MGLNYSLVTVLSQRDGTYRVLMRKYFLGPQTNKYSAFFAERLMNTLNHKINPIIWQKQKLATAEFVPVQGP